MRKFGIVVVLLFATLGVRAEISDIVVGYELERPAEKKYIPRVVNQYLLLANGEFSKFYSPRTEYFDSLKSTPLGLKRLEEMSDVSIEAGNGVLNTDGDGFMYVVKDLRKGKLTYYDRDWMQTKYVYDEPIEGCFWEVTDSTKTILGYECIKVKGDYHGRKWTVWFSPEIPIHNGPWKLDGVPGLILEATTQGGEYIFRATGIEEKRLPIGPVYLAKDYERTNRINFLRVARHKMDNAANILGSVFGTQIIVNGPDGQEEKMFDPASVLDFMETDYHKTPK